MWRESTWVKPPLWQHSVTVAKEQTRPVVDMATSPVLTKSLAVMVANAPGSVSGTELSEDMPGKDPQLLPMHRQSLTVPYCQTYNGRSHMGLNMFKKAMAPSCAVRQPPQAGRAVLPSRCLQREKSEVLCHLQWQWHL
eukprot:358445-Chlamydomonas_euryale.AAC.18